MILRMSRGPLYYACHGSFAACASLPEGLPEGDKSAACAGTVTHCAIQEMLTPTAFTGGLPILETRIAGHIDERCQRIAEEMSAIVRQVEGELAGIKAQHEVELHASGWVGHADRVTHHESGTLVWEWKTGRLEQEPAASNVQVRLYVAGVQNVLPPVRLPITAILLSMDAHDQVCKPVPQVFDDNACNDAYQEALELERRCTDPGALRIRGDHCRYCPASGTPACPESLREIEALALAEPPPVPATCSKDWYLANREQLATSYRLWKRIERVGDKLADLIRDAASQGVDMPGLVIGPDTATTVIGDVGKAWFALSETLTPDQFVSACKASLPDLVDMVCTVKAECGKKVSKKDVRAFLETLLYAAGALEQKPRRGAITIAKET